MKYKQRFNTDVIMKKYACLLLFIVSVNSNAGIRFSIGLGEGGVDFSDAENFDTQSVRKDNFALASYLGYATDSMVILDVGRGLLSNFSALGYGDAFLFQTVDALVGYHFRHKNIYIEPKVGYSKWKLKLEEAEFFLDSEEDGPFFNGSDEKQKYKDSGYDPMGMLTAGYMFGRHFGISLSYRYQDYPDGDVKSTLLGFDFKF